ncbi:transposase family protein [Actinophytocola sp. KF-1]
MRYEATTGLDHARIQELVARIQQVTAPAKRGRRPVLGLYRRVVLTLVLLRSNTGQTMLADWFGISQPTVSRVYRAMLPLLEQVTGLHRPPLPDVLRGRVVVVDGTIVPVGNRRTESLTGTTHF